MRRLIINADDFGMTAGVNRAIAEAHRQGCVSSSTLMATGAAVRDAVAIAKDTPTLSIGCHVVLVDGRPISDPTIVSSLIDSRDQGRFRSRVPRLALAAVRGKVSENEIYREVSAQFECLNSLGISLSHVDSHQHSHVLPVVARAVLRAACEHGIRSFRNPFEPAWAVAASRANWSVRSASRSFQVTVLRKWQQPFTRLVSRYGLQTPDGSIGMAATGFLNRELFLRLVDAMPDGTWELITHPGYYDSDLAAANTRLKESRAIEFEILSSAESRAMLAKRGIALISYREL
jgi:hopanoid biosynthesis associated protein HpnK